MMIPLVKKFMDMFYGTYGTQDYPIDSKGIYKDFDKVKEKVKEKYHNGRVGDVWEYRTDHESIDRLYILAGINNREPRYWIRFLLLEDIGVEGVPFFKSLVIASNDETNKNRLNKVETHKLRDHTEGGPKTGPRGYGWFLISRIDGEEETKQIR